MNYEFLNENQNSHMDDSFSKERYLQMLPNIQIQEPKILDIGIGSGIGASVIKTRYPNSEIYGLDAVKSRTLNTHREYKEILYGSAIRMSFQDDMFDIVLAGELIEHIAIQDIDQFIREVFRTLRKGGYFALTTPNPKDIKRILRKESILGESHLSQHFLRDTKSRLRMNSFRIIKTRGTGKTSKYLGPFFPKFLYGSYLILCRKL